MALVLPSTVEELNFMQNSLDLSSILHPNNMYVKESNKDFENIAVERRYKREVSFPNGVENWNINNYDTYLNFEDNKQNNLEVIQEAQDDRLVPEGESRQRCESYSSMSSSMDDKCLVYHNLGVKTYNTVCMDSGSTCISSDHTYVNSSPTIFKGLDAEETYQNLDTFLRQIPKIQTDTISTASPVGSPMNDSLDYSVVNHTFSVSSNCSQDSFSESVGIKRSASDVTIDDELFVLSSGKRTCESPNESRYFENRKKNNASSKNCRKTRKEKQKDMEIRVTELEREREDLNLQVQNLEQLIKVHQLKLMSVFQQRP